MKTKIYKLLVAMLSVVVLAGCDDWTPGDGASFPANHGGLSRSMSVQVTNPPSTPTGRASVDVSGYLVSVCNQGTDEVITYNGSKCSWAFSSMPEIVTLPVGSYTVRVRSHEPANAAWNAPYFEGAEDFTVENNKVTYIGTVTCRFKSVKVGVHFADDLKEAMDANSCSVTVEAGAAGTSLVWNTTETRYGYFLTADDNPTLVATFNGTVKGQSVTALKEITSVKTGAYYIISFSLKSGDATLPPEWGYITGANGITISYEVIESEAGSTITPGEDPFENGDDDPNEEEWPDPVDPNQPDDPNPGDDTQAVTFTSETLALGDNAVNSVDVESAIVVISAADGIAHLNVTISSDNQNFIASVGELMPVNFDLADLDETTATNLSSIGLPVNDEVKGHTSVDFNISDLVGLLGAFPGNHKFSLNVTDMNGKSNSTSLNFKAE